MVFFVTFPKGYNLDNITCDIKSTNRAVTGISCVNKTILRSSQILISLQLKYAFNESSYSMPFTATDHSIN